jgi:hypothetical protein
VLHGICDDDVLYIIRGRHDCPCLQPDEVLLPSPSPGF